MTIDKATVPCWCFFCDVKKAKADPKKIGYMRMNLCPDCGNKRCPRATDHTNECSGSNEPGQPGSNYA